MVLEAPRRRARPIQMRSTPFKLCALVVVAALLTPQRPARADDATVAVVMVPGVTGSRLLDAQTGREIWGPAGRFFRPADRGHEIALAITTQGEQSDQVVANGPLLFLRVVGWTKEVYRPLTSRLEQAGYELGDIEEPERSKSFYFFDYDWRRSNLEAVPQLHEALERIAARRGVAEVDLICQSNANRICRILAKYGDLPLERIGIDRPPIERGYQIRKILLIGVSNGGSLRQLHELERGRRYVPGVGRYMGQETLFTLRPLFEDLPPPGEQVFVDEAGRALDVDLYDAENWVRYGWSVFASETAALLPSKPGERAYDVFGSPADRKAYLQRRLRVASELHQVLSRDSNAFPDVDYYLLENGSEPTPVRAVLRRRDENTWETLFSTDREITRRLPELATVLSAIGDGHATLESQRALSPQEQAALRAVGSIEGGHFQTIVRPETLDLIVTFLQRPRPRAAATDGAD